VRRGAMRLDAFRKELPEVFEVVPMVFRRVPGCG
jgi:hypothetical protein